MPTRLTLKLLLIALVSLELSACGSISRPWDPPEGRLLFEQMPAWDNAADRLCCQHLKDYNQCRPPRNPRC
jgi:hypothetical protein